jgi:hypothetical protein
VTLILWWRIIIKGFETEKGRECYII